MYTVRAWQACIYLGHVQKISDSYVQYILQSVCTADCWISKHIGTHVFYTCPEADIGLHTVGIRVMILCAVHKFGLFGLFECMNNNFDPRDWLTQFRRSLFLVLSLVRKSLQYKCTVTDREFICVLNNWTCDWARLNNADLSWVELMNQSNLFWKSVEVASAIQFKFQWVDYPKWFLIFINSISQACLQCLRLFPTLLLTCLCFVGLYSTAYFPAGLLFHLIFLIIWFEFPGLTNRGRALACLHSPLLFS